MKLILLFFCFQIASLQSCESQNQNDIGSCWLNVKYEECLKNKLPCECEEIVQTYYSIALDTNINSKNYGIALSKFEQMEPFIYPIDKINENEYEVLKKRGSNTYWAKLVVKKDTLYFSENNMLSKFVKSEKCKVFDVQHYTVDNVDLLNKSFIAHGYPDRPRSRN